MRMRVVKVVAMTMSIWSSKFEIVVKPCTVYRKKALPQTLIHRAKFQSDCPPPLCKPHVSNMIIRQSTPRSSQHPA